MRRIAPQGRGQVTGNPTSRELKSEIESVEYVPMRNLNYFRYFCLALTLAVFSPIETKAQTESSLSARIVNALKAKEPNWAFHSFVESLHCPFVPSEKHLITGTWRGPNFPQSKSEDVRVELYSVDNLAEAAAWLEFRGKHVAEGWAVSPFHIGDEGYFSKCKDGERFEISFRKGTIVGRASAGDLKKLKDFAQVIVESIPPNGG